MVTTSYEKETALAILKNSIMNRVSESTKIGSNELVGEHILSEENENDERLIISKKIGLLLSPIVEIIKTSEKGKYQPKITVKIDSRYCKFERIYSDNLKDIVFKIDENDKLYNALKNLIGELDIKYEFKIEFNPKLRLD